MEVYFTDRNEGTYFVFVVGNPGEPAISDELRQAALDALILDFDSVDETFPPGTEEGSVTFELESYVEFTVGEDIDPGRYEVHAEIPADVKGGSLIAHQEGGSVYESFREVSLLAGEDQYVQSWAGFIELYEGDTVSYTIRTGNVPAQSDRSYWWDGREHL